MVLMKTRFPDFWFEFIATISGEVLVLPLKEFDSLYACRAVFLGRRADGVGNVYARGDLAAWPDPEWGGTSNADAGQGHGTVGS